MSLSALMSSPSVNPAGKVGLRHICVCKDLGLTLQWLNKQKRRGIVEYVYMSKSCVCLFSQKYSEIICTSLQ